MLAASKEIQLRKSLIKNAIIGVLVLSVLSAAAITLSNYHDTVDAEQTQQQSQNSSISAEYKDIQTTLGIENEVVQYHDNYIKNHNESFTINREAITDVLSSLRKKHHLASNIEVKISSITDDPSIPLKSGKMEKSTVSMRLGALSDSSIYNFIYDLQHSLPGLVLVSDLKIERKEELSHNNVSAIINQHTIVPIVAGELTFIWLGIRPNQESTSSSANGSGNAR